MAVSQNGWAAQPSSSGLASLEWITGRVLPGDVYTIFDYFCRRFHQSVEPIRRDHSWGWAYRDVRGASSLSNHASATAIDLNAPSHPLGHSGTFNATQMRALRPLLDSLDGAVRWGGDYSGRKDEMHFEINAPRALVAAVAAKIRGAATGGSGSGSGSTPTPAIPSPTPPTSEEDDDMPLTNEEIDRIALRVWDYRNAALEGSTTYDILRAGRDGTVTANKVHDLLTPGKTGVKTEGDILGRLGRIESGSASTRAAVGEVATAVKDLAAAVAGLPLKIWGYRNEKLEAGDTYSILRGIRDKVVGK